MCSEENKCNGKHDDDRDERDVGDTEAWQRSPIGSNPHLINCPISQPP